MIDSPNGDTAPDLRRSKRRRSHPDITKVDRLPPHSMECEQGVLGCVIDCPKECLPICIERLKPGADVFYDLRHQTIYKAMVEMFASTVSVDVITLQQWLKDRQLLEQTGGIAYLDGLQDCIPSSANLEYYIDFVLDKYMMRSLIQTCTQIVGRSYDFEGEVETLLDEAERDIYSVRKSTVQTTTSSTKELVQGAMLQIERFQDTIGQVLGISTGFADFDKMTTGLNPGDYFVIAARPSMGKTSLAMNIAEHVALELRRPVGVFSLEMTAEALMLRTLCSRARVNIRNVREGFLAERDLPKLTASAAKLANCPMFIDASSGLSIMQLRAKARRMKTEYGIELFIIDYLQLLHSTTNRASDNRQQEIAEISNGIKALSKELGVPIIVLSQLNRELEKRGPGGRPRLSDLRESGAIEQDADIVGLLYRKSKTNAERNEEFDDSDQEAISISLYIAKQRNGPTGDVDLTFLRPYTRFESAAKVSDDDIPDAQGDLGYRV